MSADAIPAFRRGVRLRHDAVRGAWVLLAPERLIQLDETALEILQLVDGRRSLSAIADTLAARYDAPPGEILADVAAAFADLAGKGLVAL